MPKVKIQHTMTEGTPPEAVRVTIAQGPHTLHKLDVAPGEGAVFSVDPGDYVARAIALVPHGAPIEVSFAVPATLTATAG